MRTLKLTLICSLVFPTALLAQECPNILCTMINQQTGNAINNACYTDILFQHRDLLSEWIKIINPNKAY